MDRLTRTANIIKAYYSYKKNSDSATFVKEVCGFFDFIKGEPISEADMNFLLFLANEAGVPQYFDLLKDKFTDCRISDENINALTLSALFHDASLATVYKGNIIKNLIMDCQSYTKYRPNETTGGIFVSWRRKEELPTGA